MAAYDRVIRGGNVATAEGSRVADIGIKAGKIAAIGEDLPRGEDETDAHGRIVTPGGIDSHVHIAQVSGMGVWTADDFESGTRSAMCGGTTTTISFAAQHRGQSLRKVVDEYHARAAGKTYIDYAFHLIVSDPTEQVLGQELPALIADGLTSFKIYTTYDALKLSDRQILDVLALARRHNAMTMVHCENHDAMTWLAEKLIASGRTRPKYHCFSHNMPVEREATHRVIALAEMLDTPVLIVHVSGREAMDEIRRARARGLKVYAETCPQYLFLTQDDLDKSGFDGAMCMCSPPPRDKANQEHVWIGLRDGLFDVFSSDHAPYRFDDPKGKKVAGTDASFKKIPNGVPGLEIRMPLLFAEGVLKGRLTLERFVAVTATNPAKIYGLAPQKGAIAIGADADLVVWDHERELTVSQRLLHDAMDYTPYEGMKVKGWADLVFSRGELVAKGGEPLAKAGRGRYLAHGPSDWSKPLGRSIFPEDISDIF
ncbi:MAG: dihydropyrimidinase [Rhodospirillales bacterium]|nr:dihydropyrimidinase [Rhodospirillales bacterium]